MTGRPGPRGTLHRADHHDPERPGPRPPDHPEDADLIEAILDRVDGEADQLTGPVGQTRPLDAPPRS